MKKSIMTVSCLCAILLMNLTASITVARTIRSDTGGEGNQGQNGWFLQDSTGTQTSLASLPAGVLISSVGSINPVNPTALVPSYVYAGSSVSVVATGDSYYYDAQTYPDYLIDTVNNGAVPDCSPYDSTQDPPLNYFVCNTVSAVDLEWWSGPPGSGSPLELFQIIYFDLGQPPLSTSDGYDTHFYNSTYTAITPGTGTPKEAWEIEFNCPPVPGCASGSALQYDGTLYTATQTILTETSILVGNTTITSPPDTPPGPLLNEFVFDGYSLSAPPGWIAMNLTTTVLTESAASVLTGQSVTLTATVTGKTPVPTGNVEFDSQNGVLGTAPISNGSAKLPVPFSTAGTYTVTASYKGDSANLTSTSTSQTILVSSPPAAPTVTIRVAPSPIIVGQSSTLTWSSTNATACTASGAWIGAQPTAGSMLEMPASTGSIAYTLICSGAGRSANGTATLIVNPPAPTVTIAVAPTTISAGQSATLTWSSANATACTASGAWSGSKAVSGTQSVSPTAAATYLLSCTGTGGSGSATATLSVNAASKSGGGGFSGWDLLGLGLIGLGRRRWRGPSRTLPRVH
jgi:hypothetical protein